MLKFAIRHVKWALYISILWLQTKLRISCNFWNLLKISNNFDTFPAEFGLLFIFEFPSQDPPDFTKQHLAYISRVFDVVKKVLLLAFSFKLYLHGVFLNNESIPSKVMSIFWSYVLWYFFLLYSEKNQYSLEVKAKLWFLILWFILYCYFFQLKC